MPSVRDELHMRRQVAARHFPLHRSKWIVRTHIPLRHTFLRRVHMSAKRALIGPLLVRKRIFVVAQELLGHLHVNLALVRLHLLFPAHMSRLR